MNNKSGQRNLKTFLMILFVVATFTFFNHNVYAASSTGTTAGTGSFFIPNISVNFSGENVDDSQRTVDSLQILILITILSLSPYLLIMLTAFTRIIVVLHFLRSALGTQQMPPNQVLMGLALFLTFFVMGNTFTEVNNVAVQPLIRGEITQEVAIEEGLKPFRNFMLDNVDVDDIDLFLGLAGIELDYDDYEYREEFEDDIPIYVIIPAFILTELKIGFIFGFVLFLPFIAIDMVVSSVLMAMGMMMLPPAMISLPFKIMLFILADGWNLVIIYLVKTFTITV